MMEAAGPEGSSPFDFGMSAGVGGEFNLSEFVASPDDHTDDFMASFTLDGDGQYLDHQHDGQDAQSLHPPTSEVHSHPVGTAGGSSYALSPPSSYPAMTIPQLQQLHEQIVASSSNPGTPSHTQSPASASPAGQVSQAQQPVPPAPTEQDLQAILDSMLAQSPNQSQDGGLAGGVDLGSLMGQLAGAGGVGGGQLQQQQAPPSFLPAQLNGHAQDSSTATALQRLQQLQQLQHYQSQFIQQQLDQLTRQAAEQQQKQQQQLQHQQSQHASYQAQHPSPHAHSPAYQQHAQQQQQHPSPRNSGHFRSQSLEGQNHLIRQGLPTPAHSSELYATMHQEMVSPIHLPGGQPGMYRDSSEYDLDGNLLFTPLMSPAVSQSNSTTPGSAFQSINPHPNSTDFFSPLTSPALGPVFHSADYHRQQNFANPGMSPHLLAQTSSMTMSPHLLAQQQHHRMASAPGSPVTQRRTTSSSGRSRSSRGTGSAATNGSGVGPEGKHAKARPSPLMKPTGPGSSRRKKDAQGMPSPGGIMSPHLNGIGEMDMSEPAYTQNSAYQHPHHQTHSASASPSYSNQQQNFQPPSAIPPSMEQAASESNSSPSPVDLASLQMPPPPVPTASQRRASIASNSSTSAMAAPALSISPQTPATFLNLSRPSSSTSITPMSTTPANPSPLSSPYISAADSQTRRSNGNGASASGSSQQGLVDGPRTNGVGKAHQQQQQQPVASTSTSNGIVGGARGVPTGGAYKPPFVVPVGKGKTPGAAPRPARKAGARPIARPAPPPPPPVIPKPPPEVRKTSHREAEQRRRDSLKAGFDELRVLLPPINPEAFDPDTGLPIAGASMPRLPARSPLIPDDNPNRGVSKVALLRCSNKHIGLLNGRVERRDELVGRLRREVERLRGVAGVGWEPREEGEVDILQEDVDLVEREDEDEYDEEYYEGEEEMEGDGSGEQEEEQPEVKPTASRRASVTKAKGAVPAGSRTSLGRAAAAVASARIRQGEEEEDGEAEGEGMDQS